MYWCDILSGKPKSILAVALSHFVQIGIHVTIMKQINILIFYLQVFFLCFFSEMVEDYCGINILCGGSMFVN